MESVAESKRRRGFEVGGMSWVAVIFLLLTAAVSLVWSHCRLMDSDEFLVLWTDSVGSLGRLVQVQLTAPISLDPMVYHSLTHFALMGLNAGGGRAAFAVRLTSLLGFLLMQVCVYKFVRRWADEGAAVFAMAFPALTATLFYSVEGRPYGLMLGLYGLAMVSWQGAVRGTGRRWVALVTLALAVGLTLNSHYFGLLLMVPLCAAELYRSLERRCADWAMLAAIGAGMASEVFTLPFLRAASVYRTHYYNAGGVNTHAITQAYRSLLVDYTQYSMRTQQVLAGLFVVLAVVFAGACVRQIWKRELPVEGAETVFLAGLAALPFFGFLMALVTHSFVVRYVAGAMVGLAPLLAMALMPVFRRKWATGVLLGGLFVAIGVAGVVRIGAARGETGAVMASLRVGPETKAAVMVSPTQKLYLQDFGHFATASYYEPDAEVRSRLVLVYSSAEELRWRGRDTNALTAKNMREFTGFGIEPYEGLRGQAGGQVFVLYHTGWDWTDEAFGADGARVTGLGRVMEGDAAVVRFSR